MNCKLNTYLIFDGDCTEAFGLYASAFGGTPRFLRMGDMPDAPAEQHHLVTHANLNIGDTMLMGSDSVPGYSPTLIKGNNQSVVIHPESREDADHFFAILSEGESWISLWQICSLVTMAALPIAMGYAG